MSILSYNGGAIIAMEGKDCIGIASDRRLGIQFATISTEYQKIFRMAPKVYLGLAGLATDVQTVKNIMEFRMDLYKLKEEREMTPLVVKNLLSTLLYEKRFGPYFVEPIIAGLDENNKPFISALDLIGAGDPLHGFAVSGTCTGNMYGMCESRKHYYRRSIVMPFLVGVVSFISLPRMVSLRRNSRVVKISSIISG
jgi:20S proteasome subunit beta 3